ncbi:CDP-alcohol phosphatidyltransferase family protein [Acrocarpospora catenulata]|uniref:CDP-alcohol phosphatidyltransferase family protein n=1 Tax=Acrocarpospora catenulata TaxID=2836182 RepID=UPI001BD9E964|nr:CDP-alcohol phosphatidyltransferase family protein [Acrocarpospora catenulata]
MGGFTLDDILAARKPRDSWWTVFVVDPLACRLTLAVANHTSITPNGLTRLSMLLGLGSAGCFAAGSTGALVAGAVLFYLSFTVDCMDGKIARLKGTGTPFGLWLDYVGDRVRVGCCAFAFAYGQGTDAALAAAVGVVVLDLFRYVNGPQLHRVREATREQVAAMAGGEVVFVDDRLRADPRARVRDLLLSEEIELVDLQRAFRARFPWFDRFRIALVRHRVRTHVMSGIEFHAAVFVVAPFFGPRAVIGAAAGAGALLLLFEAALVYRIWLATREAARAVPKRERVLV